MQKERFIELARVRSALVQAICSYLKPKEFCQAHVPILTKVLACTSHLGKDNGYFSLKYFDKTMYLTLSTQFYLEAFVYRGLRAYSLMPCFRNEKSDRMHLCEFWHLEVEKEGTFEELLDFIEDFVKHVLAQVLDKCRSEIVSYRGESSTHQLETTLDSSFSRFTYGQMISQDRADASGDTGSSFAALIPKPTLVTHFPKTLSEFYHRTDPVNPDLVLACDLLFPGYGEVIGAGERIHDEDELLERIRIAELPIEDYQWYVDLRKIDTLRHFGFGLGIDRLVQWLLDLPDISDAVHFPRKDDRLTP